MDKSSFAERLKELRKKAGYTQESLSEVLAISFMTVRRWESGKVTPRMDEMKKLAQALGVTDDELLNVKQETGTWQLRIEVANDFKQEVIDVSKSVPRIASIQTTPNGGFLVLGGDYSLWQDDNNFKRFVADLKKYRSVVIQNGVALGGIKN